MGEQPGRGETDRPSRDRGESPALARADLQLRSQPGRDGGAGHQVVSRPGGLALPPVGAGLRGRAPDRKQALVDIFPSAAWRGGSKIVIFQQNLGKIRIFANKKYKQSKNALKLMFLTIIFECKFGSKYENLGSR